MSWYQGILPSWYEMSWYRYQVETTKLVGTKWHCQLVRNELVPVPSRDDEMSWYQVALPSWYEMSWYQVGYRWYDAVDRSIWYATLSVNWYEMGWYQVGCR